MLWSAAIASSAHSALHLRSPARALLDAEPLHRYVAAQRHGDDGCTVSTVSFFGLGKGKLVVKGGNKLSNIEPLVIILSS